MPDHVNIFARKPLKSSLVPAKRYEPWITVFERLVGDAQRKVQELAKQEYTYNIVKEFLELQGLPNDTKVHVEPRYIQIVVMALPTNKKADIVQFNERLVATLCKNNLRNSEVCPDISWGSSYGHDANCFFSTRSGDVFTRWDISSDGIADLEVRTIREQVTSYETRYELVPRTQGVTNVRSTIV